MNNQKRLNVGIDIGGTFTDFVILDRYSGEVFTWKSLTTPRSPSKSVATGLSECLKYYKLSIKDVYKLVHGTTLVTNAIIERRGETIGLITTKGFRDTLEIGREMRYDLYDLFMKRPGSLVPRHLRKEVETRKIVSGKEQQAIKDEELIQVTKNLVEKGVKSIAISFIQAQSDNTLEKRAKKIIQKNFPNIHVSLSSDLASEIGEFERTSTVTANAYVKPLINNYLTQLDRELQTLGFGGNFYIMLSSGGFCNIDVAREYPIRLLESGPAAGALSAAYWGEATSNSRVIGFDMGGTTAKACLIQNGSPEKIFKFEAGRVHKFKKGSGLPILITTIELIEIGAGGGSIAHADNLGLLKVGPESASSEPGPACYDLGGTSPTVTDANLILGYLNPDFFLGGEIPINKTKSKEAISKKMSETLKLEVYLAAWGVHKVVNENMSEAAKIYATEKGKDHRKYTLVATGGGGPVHAYGVAKNLNLKQVVYPFAAGVSSALGMLISPAREDISKAFSVSINEVNWNEINKTLSNLEKSAKKRLIEAGVLEKHVNITRMADMKYKGQGHNVTLMLPKEPLEIKHKNQIIKDFETAYKQLFSNIIQGGEPELVNLRIAVESTEEPPRLSFYSQNKQKKAPFKENRYIFLPTSDQETIEKGEYISVPVYDRYLFKPGDSIKGPCIIEEKESTIVINGSASIYIDPFLNVVAKLKS